MRWWDTGNGKMIRELDVLAAERQLAKNDQPPTLFKAAFNAELTLLVASLTKLEGKGIVLVCSGAMYAWDLKQKKRLWELGDKELPTWTFGLSGDGNVLATLAVGSGVSVRDGWTGKETRRIQEQGKQRENRPSSVAVSPDGTTLAVMQQGPTAVQLWDVVTGKPGHKLGQVISHGFSASEPRVCFSGDGKTLAFPWAATFVLWETASGKELLHSVGHREPVHNLTFSPDGKRLVSGTRNWPAWSGPLQAVTWDTESWKKLERSETPSVFYVVGTVCKSPDQRLSFVRDVDGNQSVHERKSGKMLCKLEIDTKSGISSGSFFSPSGNLVFLPVNELLVMDAQSGKKLASLPREARENWFAVAPNDKLVAWYDTKGRVQVNEVNGGKGLWTFGEGCEGWRGINPEPTLAFSTDACYLASWKGDDNVIVVYDLKKGKEFRRFQGKDNGGLDADRWICLAFSPDGKTLAVGGFHGENDVLLFNLEKGALERRLTGHLEKVRALAFSPDGRQLASGSDDTTVLIWEIPKP